MKVGRRAQLLLIACLLSAVPLATVTAQEAATDEPVTRPVVSEVVSPLIPIEPVASDGYRGEGILRKPPGDGPFPAVVLIHGGLTKYPLERLRDFVGQVLASLFLYEGYIVAAITYRSRDIDPNSPDSLRDTVAAVEHLKTLPSVDRESVVVFGVSGGGDLALQIASAIPVAAIVVEEPATILMAGLFSDEHAAIFLRAVDDPEALNEYLEIDWVAAYRSKEDNQAFSEALARISSPILMIEGPGIPFAKLIQFNDEILVPELRTAGKAVDVLLYGDEPHGFLWRSEPPATRSPNDAIDAFEKTDEFFRQHIRRQPTRFVDFVPVNAGP